MLVLVEKEKVKVILDKDCFFGCFYSSHSIPCKTQKRLCEFNEEELKFTIFFHKQKLAKLYEFV